MMNKKKYQTLAVGITGGIGSGKSEVCKIFESLGSIIIRADEVAKDLAEMNNTIKKDIRKVFGEDAYLPDGKLNRTKIAEIIFNNQEAKEKLNSIIHPRVLEYLNVEIEKAKETGEIPVMLIEAALIYEANSEKMYDYMIVVDADEETRINRIITRDKCSRNDVIQRMKAQMPVNVKIERADFVIENSDNKNRLEEKTIFIYKLLQTIAATKNR